MAEASKSKPFWKRVLDYLEGGEESKIKRFHKKVVKNWKDQISILKDEISEFNEQIDDQNEQLTEAMLNVDMGRIKTVDSTNEYIKTYTLRIHQINKKIDSYKDKISNNESDIESFENLIKLIK